MTEHHYVCRQGKCDAHVVLHVDVVDPNEHPREVEHFCRGTIKRDIRKMDLVSADHPQAVAAIRRNEAAKRKKSRQPQRS